MVRRTRAALCSMAQSAPRPTKRYGAVAAAVDGRTTTVEVTGVTNKAQKHPLTFSAERTRRPFSWSSWRGRLVILLFWNEQRVTFLLTKVVIIIIIEVLHLLHFTQNLYICYVCNISTAYFFPFCLAKTAPGWKTSDFVVFQCCEQRISSCLLEWRWTIARRLHRFPCKVSRKLKQAPPLHTGPCRLWRP